MKQNVHPDYTVTIARMFVAATTIHRVMLKLANAFVTEDGWVSIVQNHVNRDIMD